MMPRVTIAYSVGNEHNPGDPFGRSELSIADDGAARLDHFGRDTGHRAWTGRLEATSLATIRAALERAGFPNVPPHEIPGGSTMRKLSRDGATALVEWYAAKKMAGYADAFPLLDRAIRQLSEDSVHLVPAGEPVVRDVKRA